MTSIKKLTILSIPIFIFSMSIFARTYVEPNSIAKNHAQNGMTQFRGNPTRTFYGVGPVPREKPSIQWKYPKSPIQGTSLVYKKVTHWTGTGWTGQPVIWTREDGILELIVGALDGAVHFINANTGEATRPKFQTGDIIKGSVTLDPNGFPLLYFGSRDNYLRIISLQGNETRELWKLDGNAQQGRMWDNDWDGNPLIVNDILFEGGENSWVYGIKLNRGYDSLGKVQVTPEIILQMPGFNDELLKNIGDRTVSIESSVAMFESNLYFANSGGRVVGLDISKLENLKAPIVFDFWTGDDTDATTVIDEEGMLYVASEVERMNQRSKDVGQFIKLNPYNPSNPILWSIPLPPVNGAKEGGIWATPALGKELIYVSTHSGRLLAVDKQNGDIVWEKKIGYHAWSSPIIVDGVLVVGMCSPGGFLAIDISDERNPIELWKINLPGCVESTPIIWDGSIYIGNRDGFIYKID